MVETSKKYIWLSVLVLLYKNKITHHKTKLVVVLVQLVPVYYVFD